MKAGLLFIILVLFFSSAALYSQEKNDSTKTSPLGIDVTLSKNKADKKLDSLNDKKLGIIGYPFAFYSPEKQLAIGVGGMLYFRLGMFKNINLSKVVASAYYTTNEQYNFSIVPKIYFPGIEQMYLDSKINFSKEEGKYYGTGNNTYETDSANYLSNVFYLKAAISGFNLFKTVQTGLVYEYKNSRIKDKRTNPFLLDSNTRGANNGKIGGLGLGLLLDKRDNVSYPEKGTYVNLQAIFYRKPFGSNFTYNKFYIDIRQFVMPFKSHILGFQFLGDLTSGDVPFFSLPALGGSTNMRGYFEGRYRDKQYITAQADYRKILFWRIGVNAFYSIGQVSSRLSGFKMNEFKHSYGFGIRFVFDEKERINLRADIGIANGTTGIYFQLDEAF